VSDPLAPPLRQDSICPEALRHFDRIMTTDSTGSRKPFASLEADAPKRQYMLLWTAMPDAIRRDMRTRSDAAGAEAPSVEDVMRGAGKAVEQLIRARRTVDPISGHRMLGVGATTNRVTGRTGLILRRRMPGGRYSPGLAEHLAPSGTLDDDAKGSFDQIAAALSKGPVDVLVHDERESGGWLTTFAVLRQDGEPGRMWYLARLLVTPFEIEQWSDALMESVGDAAGPA
jgi:hypothetical protein